MFGKYDIQIPCKHCTVNKFTFPVNGNYIGNLAIAPINALIACQGSSSKGKHLHPSISAVQGKKIGITCRITGIRYGDTARTEIGQCYVQGYLGKGILRQIGIVGQLPTIPITKDSATTRKGIGVTLGKSK